MTISKISSSRNPRLAQRRHMVRSRLGGGNRQQLDVVEHDAVGLGQRDIAPVPRQADYLLSIAADELTESLSVERRSISAPVQCGRQDGNHLLAKLAQGAVGTAQSRA